MKKHALLLTFVISCYMQSFPQSPLNSIIKDGDKITFFTGPFSRTKWFNNSTVENGFGGGAGFYFSHKYYLYVQTTSCPIVKGTENTNSFVMNMFGASVGYCFNPLKKIHFVAGTQIYKSTVINKEDINPVDVELNYLKD